MAKWPWVLGSVAAALLIAGAAYGAVDRGDPVDGIEVLSTLGPNDVVLSVREPARVSGIGFDEVRVIVVHADSGDVSQVSPFAMRASLGDSLDEWPMVSLVAVQPQFSRAVFLLQDPSAMYERRIGVHNWETRDTVVVDPCASSLESVDVSAWCAKRADSATVVVDPQSGRAVTVEAFQHCAVADEPAGKVLAAVCSSEPFMTYLVTVDPATGDVLHKSPLGLAPVAPPWVVDGQIFANSSTVEGDPVLSGTASGVVVIGGGAAGGLAQVGDRLLVLTGSDRFGPDSSFGRVLGFWSPESGDFAAVDTGSIEGDAKAVAVLP